MTIYYTYFHTRNDTGKVFYVGKGKGKRARSKDSHNPHWKSIVAKHGYMAHFAMTNLNEAAAFEHEKFLIACFRNMKTPLVNCTDGGEGCSGAVLTPETRARMSAAKKGRLFSLEHRANMSAAMKALSPEILTKIVTAGRNRIFSSETRAKISAANKARVVSTDTRAKHRIAHMGKINSPEVRAKISAAHTGKTRTPETRARMSAAQKEWWAQKKMKTTP